MRVPCFGKFNSEQEECAYCEVVDECENNTSNWNHPRSTQKKVDQESEGIAYM